jgi:hypothetical protein
MAARSPLPSLPSKPCVHCGRPFAWRKKWERCWEAIRYCSDACRRARKAPDHASLEEAIRSLLAARRPGATICPSEAARSVSPDAWRELMEPARQAARRLALAGEIVITQGGRPVDPGSFKGPIRLRSATRESDL